MNPFNEFNWYQYILITWKVMVLKNGNFFLSAATSGVSVELLEILIDFRSHDFLCGTA